MFKGKTDQKAKKNWVRHNEQIRIPQVLVIHEGENLGLMQSRDALLKARNLDLDLVEVAPTARPPVCWITDYGKYMYDRQKKEKQKGAVQKEKQIDFRYVIDDHDLETKAGHIRKFLEKGMKVKCLVKFKQREKAHKDHGFVLLNKLINLLSEVADVEIAPQFEGVNVMMRLELNKDHKKKMEKEAAKEAAEKPEEVSKEE